MRQTVSFGAWPSPLSARDITGSSTRFGGLSVLADRVLWVEGRADEKGRGVLVESREGRTRDLTPEPHSVRSRVNEYGGRSFWPAGDGIVFSDDGTQSLSIISGDGSIDPLFNSPTWRFADGCCDSNRERTICVAEIHEDEGHPKQGVVSVSLSGKGVTFLQEGRDFYAAPRLSPDGKQLAFLAWDLPFMPWQAAELWCASVDTDGKLSGARLLGGGLNRAAFQPEWTRDGRLCVSLEGRNGSMVHIYDPVGGWTKALDTPGESNRPLWGLGTSSYCLSDKNEIAVGVWDQGSYRLFRGPLGGHATEIKAPLDAQDLSFDGDGNLIAFVSAHDAAPSIRQIDVSGGSEICRFGADPAQSADVSLGTLVALEGQRGPIHALYYPPTLEGFNGPEGQLPPMIVKAHGGPTGYAERGYAPKTQFWTSRGFAVLDVDYRGSFGYGTEYRRALDGQMGLADIGDVADAAVSAASMGLADQKALFISGGSAGGYVVLGALAYFDVFTAGCSRYGIGDLAQLAAATHKFEAGYLDTLLGLTGDETDAAVLNDRSPLFAVDRISVPVLLQQGSDDKVVPPEQSRNMAKALEDRGVPVAYIEYEGEGHGFRGEAAVLNSIETEYAFYSAILGLPNREELAKVDIRNWNPTS